MARLVSLNRSRLQVLSRPAERRVADLVVDTLVERGVDTFYGIPGGAISSVYDALVDHEELRVINARQETGAVYMAIGHTRAMGSLPCVLVTSGPGIINALTGIAAAQADGVPLIVLGGEVPRRNFGRGALQEGSRYHLDILGMVRSVTKYCAEISNPRSAASVVQKAAGTALSGRQGPVFLSLPLDIANEVVGGMSSTARVETRFDLDGYALEEAAELLQSSERGLIYAGSGARHPETVRLIHQIATMLGIPVMTTPKAKGVFPESHPLSLGIFGYGGHPSATEYLGESPDVLLCVGCGLGETSTNGWTELLEPGKALIQVDIDGAQIGRNYAVDVGLIGPAHQVLTPLVAKLSPRPRKVFASGRRFLAPERMTSDTTPMQPARALASLQEISPASTLFTSDVGEHTLFALHYLTLDDPNSFIVNLGLGAMGSGIGAAIGAKVARPDRHVVCICGDYGFQMHGMELATCVQDKIGVVFAIFNDARMRMVESGMHQIFGRSRPMHAPALDFAQLAKAVGARGFTLETPADFAALPTELAQDGAPVVLDIHIDPTASFAANGRVAQLKGFTGE
ncbi:MAG: thiamine pyrophosphate-binding protein [Myxococcaceae bacterium]